LLEYSVWQYLYMSGLIVGVEYGLE
jgi:hypothetical protein